MGFNRSQKKGERKGEEKKIIELYHKENKRQNQPRTLGKLKKKQKKTNVTFAGEVGREGFTLTEKRTLR